MNVPPILGLVISLALGIFIGGYGMQQRLHTEQVKADVEQVEIDNDLAVDIADETVELKQSNTVVKTVIKWRSRPPVKIPRELTENEVDIICINRNVPSDVMQSIRHEVAKARERFSNL